MTYETTTIQCTGEAHSNAYIDNCGVCMPEWGQITVCKACIHRPGEHAEDGCHASANDSDMASERCSCKAKFTRQGGKRTKKFVVEINGDMAIHHGEYTSALAKQGREKNTEVTVIALRPWDALRDVRRAMKQEFVNHIATCQKEDCFVLHRSIYTRGTSTTGGGYSRGDFKVLRLADKK